MNLRFFSYIHKSLTGRIATVSALLVAGSVSFAIYLQFQSSQRSMEALLETRHQLLAERAAYEVESHLASSKEAIVTLAKKITEQELKDPVVLQAMLEKIPDIRPHGLVTLSVVSMTGHTQAWVPATTRPAPGSSVADRYYFRLAASAGEPAIEGPLRSRFLRTPVVVIAAPIVDNHNKTVAVLTGAIEVTSSRFFLDLNKFTPGKEGYFIVSSKDGIIVAHPNPELVGEPLSALGAEADVFQKAQHGETVVIRGKNSDGTPCVYAFRAIKGPEEGWMLAAVGSENELFRPLVKELHGSVFIGVVASLGCVIFLWLTVTALMAPLRSIQAGAKKLAESPDESTLDTKPTQASEVQALAHEISRISEARVSAVRGLRAGTSLLQAAMNSVSEAVIATDPEGRIQAINHAASRLTGWRAADAMNRSLHQVYHTIIDASSEPAPCPLAQALEERVPITRNGMLAQVARDKQRTPIDETVSPFMLPDGHISGAVIVFKDVAKSRIEAREHAAGAELDPATGLYGMGWLQGRLAEVLELARREHGRHALITLDVAQILPGLDCQSQRALWSAVGLQCRASIRTGDAGFCWGPDTLLLVLTNCDLAEVLFIAETLLSQLRHYLEEAQYETHSRQFNLGVLTFEKNVESLERLFQMAQELLQLSRTTPNTVVPHPKSAGADAMAELADMLR